MSPVRTALHPYQNYLRHAAAGTAQNGKSNVSGSSGGIYFMPEGCETKRDNRGYVRWLRIYFRDEHMRRATFRIAELIFSCDPAFREMTERFVLALDWAAGNDHLALDHT